MKNEFILKYKGRDLLMPDWGDFGEYVIITEKLESKMKNITNALFGGLF